MRFLFPLFLTSVVACSSGGIDKIDTTSKVSYISIGSNDVDLSYNQVVLSYSPLGDDGVEGETKEITFSKEKQKTDNLLLPSRKLRIRLRYEQKSDEGISVVAETKKGNSLCSPVDVELKPFKNHSIRINVCDKNVEPESTPLTDSFGMQTSNGDIDAKIISGESYRFIECSLKGTDNAIKSIQIRYKEPNGEAPKRHDLYILSKEDDGTYKWYFIKELKVYSVCTSYSGSVYGDRKYRKEYTIFKGEQYKAEFKIEFNQYQEEDKESHSECYNLKDDYREFKFYSPVNSYKGVCNILNTDIAL